ncbi:MAG: hypothetical protein PHQ58_11000 [Rhodoferax sp.]|uniref:hypothetical protein n=1 Tax=Rhodoferax sp. TaxID=50421 RepID=UPI002610E786|nr:hypothetical protein [Rhodoferax sp.]MDD2880959.1 hypothetical protein [Rhodoferax sp.]
MDRLTACTVLVGVALVLDLLHPGTELMRFARFADARDHQGTLTLDLQLDWAREYVARTSTVTAARRLEVVRPFATYYRQFEPATEVPPPFILGRGHRRLAPHIYTDQEIRDLLALTDRMTPPGGLRPKFAALHPLFLRQFQRFQLHFDQYPFRDGWHHIKV